MRRAGLALALLATAILAPAPADAKLYRWVDERGNVHYSDSPPQGQRRAADDPAPPPPTPPPVTPPRPAAPPAAERRPERPRAAAPARPSEPAPALAARIDPVAAEILQLAGIVRYVDHIAAQAREESGRRAWQLRAVPAARGVVTRAYAGDALVVTVARALMRHLPPGDVEPVLAWMRSPLSKKLHELRDDARSPERRQQYLAFVGRLPDAMPPSRRLALVHALERAGGHAAFQLEVMRALRTGLDRVLRPALEAPAAASADDDEGPDRAGDGLRFWLVTQMLFAYLEVPDAELEEAVRFASSPVGARFVQACRAAVLEALEVAEREASARLRPLLARPRH